MELVSDERWSSIVPLLPPHPPPPQGGHAWQPDRPARCGIRDICLTGSGWHNRPLALGCESGSPCWRRLHRVLLDAPGDADAIA